MMHMQGRIAVLGLAIGFLAAPGLGAVEMDTCPPCCPQPTDTPCEPCASLAAMACCDAPPVAPASPQTRAIDPPALHPIAGAVRFGVPTPRRTLLARVADDLAVATTPLRLSVVLLI